MKKIIATLSILLLVGSGCSIKYSFSGASIDPNMKTVSIMPFPNNATNAAPTLAPTLYDVLTQKIQRETRLQITREGGQGNFEGQITDYRSEPISLSGNDEYATKNRLTITLKVRYTNTLDPKFNFDKSFSEYADYDSNQMLTSVEGGLIDEIVKKLVQNIFNEAFANW